MKDNKIINFMCGYLLVCADSKFIERFINICLHRGINIFDIKKCGSDRVIFKTDAHSYFQIRMPARRTKTHVKIIKRCGVPFILRKYKSRKLAILVVFLVGYMMWYTSNHVMGVTVYGNNRISTQTINEALVESGLKVGVKTTDVTPDIIRNKMMIKLSDLAWVGINANGSRVYVEIIERTEKDEGVDKNAPACDLVAKCDGEIEKLEIREGQTVVNIGSGVRKGDVLVSGVVDNPSKGFSYVHARGNVYAKTRYTLSKAYPLNYIEKTESGRKKSYYSIKVKDKSIPLYFFEKPSYEHYDIVEKEKEYNIPFGIIPSVTVKEREYVEVNPSEKKITPNDAVKTGGEELTAELKKGLDDKVEVLNENVTYTLSEKGEAIVTVELVCREDIAKEYIIEVSMSE